jgi:hypothetical protein
MEQFLTWVTDTFNNRELAIGIWLLVAVVVFVLAKALRSSLFGIVRSLLAPSLLVFFGFVATTVAVLCILLAQFGFWTTDQLPATILWFLVSGCLMAGRALSAKEDEGHFKGLFRNSIGLTGVFEFIVVAYSFSLVTELILLPVLFLLGFAMVMAERDPNHAKPKAPLVWIIVAIVGVILWNSLSQIWYDPSLFWTTTTGRNFFLPVLLTVGCIPTFYLLFCYSHIQGARIQINLKTFQSDDFKRYARKKLFLTFGLRPWLLRRATRQFHVLPAKTNADVDQIIKDILDYERNNEAPPSIDPSLGWSPFLARDFLKEHGLRTDDYHKGYDEYWASAKSVDLDDQILPNNATFDIEGEKNVVKTLKLTGKFQDEFEGASAMVKLREVAHTLCENALGETVIDFVTLLPDADVFENIASVSGTTLKTWAKRYPNEMGFEVFLTLSR